MNSDICAFELPLNIFDQTKYQTQFHNTYFIGWCL